MSDLFRKPHRWFSHELAHLLQVQAVGIVSMICKNLQQLMKKETDNDVGSFLLLFMSIFM